MERTQLGIRISVAMCTFNGSRYLSEQLDSIAAQNRPPDEVVVCDDASSDSSPEILAVFARRVPFPVRIFVNESNLGSTRNFEKAISLCEGDIVALADQDDVWYRHKLERMNEAFLRSSDVVAAFSDADLIDGDTRPLGLRLWPTFAFDRARQRQLARGQGLRVLIRHSVVTGATMAFRRELFNSMVPIPTNEVHDRWISFLLAVIGRFELIGEPLMQYRRHPGQQMGTAAVTLPEKLRHAGRTGASFHIEESERFRQLSKRLEASRKHFPHAEYALQEIAQKLSHLEHRARLSPAKVARIPGVLSEVINGNYWRYSGGWRSLAKDLIIR
jgi:glycosyltransferase involved in cell wall biosynthesis